MNRQSTKRRVLHVQDAVFYRKERPLLARVSLSVGRGKIVGLLGVDGAGKTSLLDIICGLRSQESGRVAGVPMNRIAYLPQIVTIPEALRLGEMALLIYGLPVPGKSVAAAAINGARSRILEKFEALWQRRVNDCSYGEQRWFILMVILSMDADLYVLDEPAAGLDAECCFLMWETLSRLKDDGKSVLFSTSLVTDVDRQIDGFYFLNAGAARRFGSTAKLMVHCGGGNLKEAFSRYLAR